MKRYSYFLRKVCLIQDLEYQQQKRRVKSVTETSMQNDRNILFMEEINLLLTSPHFLADCPEKGNRNHHIESSPLRDSPLAVFLFRAL